jgi:inosose dehydratase
MLWKYGASPINWCNDDLEDLGDNYSVEQILSDMRDLGVAGTELGRKFPRSTKELLLLLDRYGLALASGWSQIHVADRRLWDAEFAIYEQHVRFLREMGATVVVTAEGTGSVHWDLGGDRPQRIPWSEAQWRTVCEGLNRAGQICIKHGMRLVYHPHLGTNVESLKEIVRLLEHTDPAGVGLVVDTGHVAAAGGDPAWLIHHFPNRVGHVHMKSVRPEVLSRYRSGLSFLDAVRAGIFTVPGDGTVDFQPILGALTATHYNGWCIIEAEQDPAVADPVVYMRKALDYLRKLTS